MGLPLEMYEKIGFSMPLMKSLQLSYCMHDKIREVHKGDQWVFYSQKGSLLGIKYLHYNRIGGHIRLAIDYAAKNGHNEVLRWLHMNRSEGCIESATALAKQYGHTGIVEILQTIYNEGCCKYTKDGLLCSTRRKVWEFVTGSYRCPPILARPVRPTGNIKVLQYLSSLRN